MLVVSPPHVRAGRAILSLTTRCERAIKASRGLTRKMTCATSCGLECLPE